MVIEHQFVTTMDAPEAMRTASEFLTSRGFAVKGQNAFAVGGGWTTLEVSRGRKNAARAKSVAELPQRVRLDFDRGRMTVAAAIEYFRHGAFGTSAREPAPDSKKVRDHAALLTAIVQGLELLLANRLPPEQASSEWATVEQRIIQEGRRRRRRNFLAAVIIIVVGVAAIVTMALTIGKH